jgi:predicted PurR-regulated permease PerM
MTAAGDQARGGEATTTAERLTRRLDPAIRIPADAGQKTAAIRKRASVARSRGVSKIGVLPKHEPAPPLSCRSKLRVEIDGSQTCAGSAADRLTGRKLPGLNPRHKYETPNAAQQEPAVCGRFPPTGRCQLARASAPENRAMKEQRAAAPDPSEHLLEQRELGGTQKAIARATAVAENGRSIGILILTTLAVVFTLYLGKEILLPIALAIVMKLLLAPAMRLLHDRLRLPEALAAVLLILAVFGALAAVGFTVSVPASGWIQKAPESLPLLKEKLAILRQPLDFVQQGLHEIDTMTSTAGQGQALTVQQGSGIAGHLATGTATTLSRFFTTMIVLFFLLASGDRLLRGFVEVLPGFKEKRQAVEIASEIEENITGYLLTITIMNGLVGIVTGIAMQLCGLGDPILWGSVAFFLNYIPILGPLTAIAIFFLAGVVAFEWPWYALVPAGIYLMIHIAEGETITPMLLARRFTLNPVLVIISLFFWHAIWGIPGALLAVPLLAMFKIIADRIEPLKPIGHMIGA